MLLETTQGHPRDLITRPGTPSLYLPPGRYAVLVFSGIHQPAAIEHSETAPYCGGTPW